MIDYQVSDKVYSELKLLGIQYSHYITMKIEGKLVLSNLLDRTIPGIKKLSQIRSNQPQKDKLNDFVKEYWHYDNITKKSANQFIASYLRWAKKEGIPSK